MCGIFGIINYKNDKLDKRAFNILGINNDSRGGDSCGIFIDGNVEYGVNDKKLYEDFYKESKLLNNTDTCKIALGHCRKASVGDISERTAQPVVIHNKEGKTDFVLLHNGTIHNYKELAEKYIPGVNITGLTDSQVMALIFYYKGYDVLSEYQGGGVFFMVDYRSKKPKVMAFQGKSKTYYYGNTLSVERPFFFIRNEEKFMFSSISSYLEPLMPDAECYTITPNTLVNITSKGVFKLQTYNRESQWQDKTTPSNSVFSYGGYGYSSYYDEFGDYDDPELTYSGYTGIIYPRENGIFTRQGQPVHGEFNVTATGSICKKSNKSTIKVYFWDGVLLYDKQCFDFLSFFCESYGIAKPSELKMFVPALICALSPIPVSSDDYIYEPKLQNLTCEAVDSENFQPFTGTVKYPFSSRKTEFVNGVKTAFSYNINTYEILQDFKNKSKAFDFDKKMKELNIEI